MQDVNSCIKILNGINSFFSKIPHEYLTWIKEISSKYSNYYEVLPKVSYGHSNVLENTYASEMTKAISEIAFIPRTKNPEAKVLASHAVMDKMRISEAISKEILVAHINRKNSKSYSVDDFITPIWKGSKLLEEYGVFVFDKEKLKNLFEDKDAFVNISTEFDVKLIDFLFEYYLRNTSEQDEIMAVLQNTKFLLDENGKLTTADNLFFPSQYKECNDFAQDAAFIHTEINEHLGNNHHEYEWIAKLGVEELSDITFIKNIICRKDYINIDNAIEIGRFVFSVNKKIDLFSEISSNYFECFYFLTTCNSLKSPSELYFSSRYRPDLDIEPLYKADIYVSSDYIERNEDIEEWKVFFKKMGIVSSFELAEIKKERSDFSESSWGDIVETAWEKSKLKKNLGWGYQPQYIILNYYPLIRVKKAEYSFSQYFWNKVFEQEYVENDNSRIVGYYGLYWSFRAEPQITNLTSRKLREYILVNLQTFPTTNKAMLPARQIFLNTSINKELSGSYLPVLNIDNELHQSWINILPFKQEIDFPNYLELLKLISIDEKNLEQNKERISKIYQRLVELDTLNSLSKTEQIKEWAKKHKILSKDGTFRLPAELSHITLDGFKTENRVYIGSPSDRGKVIELLSLMGVKVITESSINPSFIEKTESKELQKLLISKLSPLAIISINDDLSANSYRERKNSLHEILSSTHFYHCESIRLTYGNDNDTIEKNTFGNKNEFYYTGSLRPANVEPLLTPLCKYLGIKGKERELFILLIENTDGIRQNLEDKGYDTSLLEEENYQDSGTLQVTLGGYNPGVSDRERNVRTGFKGEILVYEKLLSMGYHPVCPSISTEDDYEQVITIKGKDYYCKTNYDKYDISFETKSGITVYLEVKATTRDKSSQENMPISYRELSMIEECDTDENCSYMIVRVFGIDKDTQDFYVFTGHLLND